MGGRGGGGGVGEGGEAILPKTENMPFLCYTLNYRP